jgi:putative DNA primase/helicase
MNGDVQPEPGAEAPSWSALLADFRGRPLDELREILDASAPGSLRYRVALIVRSEHVAADELITGPSGDGQAGTPPTPPVRGPMEWKRNDMGNGERLVATHGRDLRFCRAWDDWLAWDGTRWRPGAEGEAMRRAKATVRRIWQDVADVGGDGGVKLAKWARASGNVSRLRAMLATASSEPGIEVEPSALDADPWTLNAANGTVDLRTGELRPHRREDLCTKRVPVPYHEAAEAPRWRQFLREVFEGDAERVAFVQRAAGYALTGSTREQALFILYGTGANGKSVFLETLAHVLGDYAQSARAELLMQRRQSGGPSEAEAALHGARLVTTSETNAGGRFDEATVKRLTGSDTIRARRLYQQEFEFEPTHKIWFATNHRPEITGTDYAIWRRLHLIPFGRRFGPDERDEGLTAVLRHEAPGVLRWAVEGCLAWQREGLNPPEAVTDATATYRAEMDVVGAFLDECCVTDRAEASVQSTELYDRYRSWCERTGETAQSHRTFGESMTERGFEKKRRSAGYFYLGIGIRSRRGEEGEPF